MVSKWGTFCDLSIGHWTLETEISHKKYFDPKRRDDFSYIYPWVYTSRRDSTKQTYANVCKRTQFSFVLCYVRMQADFASDWSHGRISDWFFISVLPLVCMSVPVPTTDGWMPLSTKTKQLQILTRATCFFLWKCVPTGSWYSTTTDNQHPLLSYLTHRKNNNFMLW